MPEDLRVSRRGLLVAVSLGVGATACATNQSTAPLPTTSATALPVEASFDLAASLDDAPADVALLAEILTATDETFLLARSASGNRSVLNSHRALAKAHATVLREALGENAPVTPGELPAKRATLARVRRRERARANQLERATLAAESGAVARLCASMAAAVDAQLGVGGGGA